MRARPSFAELVAFDGGLWVRSIIGVALLWAGLALLARGQLFGLFLLAGVAWFAYEIFRRVALLRTLGARGILAKALLIREDAPDGESDWWSGQYEFEFEGRRYEHRALSFMFSPRSSHGTVVGIVFDPLDPERAVIRDRYDQVGPSGGDPAP